MVSDTMNFLWFAIVFVFSFSSVAGLECYKCYHIQCDYDTPNACNFTQNYLNQLNGKEDFEVEFSDMMPCPTQYKLWNDSDLIEKCSAEQAFCGKRQVRIITTTHQRVEEVETTEYPILHPVGPGDENVYISYYTVYGCTNPKEVECGSNEDMFLVPEFNTTIGADEYNFQMSFTSKTDCRKCDQWLCNAEDLSSGSTSDASSTSRPIPASLIIVLAASTGVVLRFV